MEAPNEHQAGDQAAGPESFNSKRSIEPDVSCRPASTSLDINSTYKIWENFN